MRHATTKFLSGTGFLIAFTVAAYSQSTLTLDSFDIADPVKSEARTPDSGNQSRISSCLLYAKGCPSENESSHAFSLDDVVNLGIVDRREVTEGTTSEKAAQAAATPLPSIDLEIRFEYASDNISGDQIGDLYVLARELREIELKGRELVLLGHTDSAGSALYNRDLSLRRANSVASFLSNEAGIMRHQIRTAGLGFDYLKYPDDPMHGANRRVQILLVDR
jgi:outer membrane protein OmpA-like peptidoglycan-associated protein